MENKTEILIKLKKELNWSDDLLPYVSKASPEADYIQFYVDDNMLPEIEKLFRNYLMGFSPDYVQKKEEECEKHIKELVEGINKLGFGNIASLK